MLNSWSSVCLKPSPVSQFSPTGRQKCNFGRGTHTLIHRCIHIMWIMCCRTMLRAAIVIQMACRACQLQSTCKKAEQAFKCQIFGMNGSGWKNARRQNQHKTWRNSLVWRSITWANEEWFSILTPSWLYVLLTMQSLSQRDFPRQSLSNCSSDTYIWQSLSRRRKRILYWLKHQYGHSPNDWFAWQQ